MPKPLILFDMDGTLIVLREKPKYTGTTTYHGSYMSIKSHMKEIVVSHGVPPELVKDLNRMAHIWNATRRFLEDNDYSEEQIQRVIDEINEPFMVEERADHEVSVLMDGTLDGLQALRKQGYELGTVTTASRESYERISNSDEYGCFGRFFKHSVTRDDCRYIKPEPEPIHRILEMFNTDSFIYVGDADHDHQACTAAGGRFVLINTREYDEETIESMKPDAVISKLTELPTVLRNLLD